MSDIQVENLPREDSGRPAEPATQTDTSMHLLLNTRFNIDHATPEENGKLKEIWDHAVKLSGSNDPQDVLWEVMHLKNTLGAPRLGESPLDKVYRWAKLKRQQTQIEEELRNV